MSEVDERADLRKYLVASFDNFLTSDNYDEKIKLFTTCLDIIRVLNPEAYTEMIPDITKEMKRQRVFEETIPKMVERELLNFTAADPYEELFMTNIHIDRGRAFSIRRLTNILMKINDKYHIF